MTNLETAVSMNNTAAVVKNSRTSFCIKKDLPPGGSEGRLRGIYDPLGQLPLAPFAAVAFPALVVLHVTVDPSHGLV